MSTGRKKLASRLRNKVAIQQPVRISDGAGGYTQSWEDFAVVSAEIEPFSGRERFSSFQLKSEVSHKITIRYIAGINSDMRIMLGSREFNIRSSVNPLERNEQLVLLCDEGSGT